MVRPQDCVILAPWLGLGESQEVQVHRICLPMQEMQEIWVGQDDPLEVETATHSSILA